MDAAQPSAYNSSHLSPGVRPSVAALFLPALEAARVHPLVDLLPSSWQLRFLVARPRPGAVGRHGRPATAKPPMRTAPPRRRAGSSTHCGLPRGRFGVDRATRLARALAGIDGVRAFRAVSWARPHPTPFIVLVSANTEYFLPSAVNRFGRVRDRGDGPALTRSRGCRRVDAAVRDSHHREDRAHRRARGREPMARSRPGPNRVGVSARGRWIGEVPSRTTAAGARARDAWRNARRDRTMAPAMVKGCRRTICRSEPSDTFTMAGYRVRSSSTCVTTRPPTGTA